MSEKPRQQTLKNKNMISNDYLKQVRCFRKHGHIPVHGHASVYTLFGKIF